MKFPKLVIREQVPVMEDLRYSAWTMERLLEDIHEQCLDKQTVKEAYLLLKASLGDLAQGPYAKVMLEFEKVLEL